MRTYKVLLALARVAGPKPSFVRPFFYNIFYLSAIILNCHHLSLSLPLECLLSVWALQQPGLYASNFPAAKEVLLHYVCVLRCLFRVFSPPSISQEWDFIVQGALCSEHNLHIQRRITPSLFSFSSYMSSYSRFESFMMLPCLSSLIYGVLASLSFLLCLWNNYCKIIFIMGLGLENFKN